MNPSLWSHNCNEQVKNLSSHFLPKEIFAHLKGGYFSNEAATTSSVALLQSHVVIRPGLLHTCKVTSLLHGSEETGQLVMSDKLSTSHTLQMGAETEVHLRGARH